MMMTPPRTSVAPPRGFAGDASDDRSVDSFWNNSDSDSEDVACWALDSVRLCREQDVEPPAELAGGLKAVDLDAAFGYAATNPRVTEEERWKEDDAEPLVVAPAATTVIEETEEIDAEAEAEWSLFPGLLTIWTTILMKTSRSRKATTRTSKKLRRRTRTKIAAPIA